MATVYKAYDTRLERDVAVKVIRRGAFPAEHHERVLKRFEREAKALAKLSHPNIVKVHDYGEYEGSPYLVLEFLPGHSLKQKLGRPMPWREALRLVLPVARALAYAHRQDIVHRDVKPSNILITEEGEPMLSDFGVAKLLDLEETVELTGTGVGVGTPEYMAPEQVTGKAVDARSDVYALGIVLYEMLTGRRPFTADTPMAVLFKHASEPLPRLRQFGVDVPQGVENLLLKALAKRPEDRYQSMSAFAQAVEEAMQGKNSARRPVSSKRRDAVAPGLRGRSSGSKVQRIPVRAALIAGATLFVLGSIAGLSVLSRSLSSASLSMNPPADSPTKPGPPTVTAMNPALPLTMTPSMATPARRADELTFASDRDGVWNVYRVGRDSESAVAILPAESAVRIAGNDEIPGFSYSWSPDGSRLLFVDSSDKRSVNLFDSGQVRLISDHEHDYINLQTAWSPDSNRLLFGSKQFTNNTTITIIDLDTMERREYGTGNSEVWSPDGTSIAFVRDAMWVEEDAQLYTMVLDNPVPRLLANGTSPQWSPDGLKIAYSYGSAVQLMHSVGGYIGQAGLPGLRWGFDPAWSPDSARIAYVTSDGDLRICLVNGLIDVGLFDQGFSGNYWADYDLVWSPDGSLLSLGTLLSQKSGEQWVHSRNLVMVDPEMKEIVSLGEGASPVFSPDSKTLAFVSGRDGNSEIYIVNSDGSGLLNITNHPANDIQPDWIENRQP